MLNPSMQDMSMNWCAQWLVLWFCLAAALGLETHHLSNYETLSHVRVSSYVKRSSMSQAELIKNIHFQAFRKNFVLTLKSGSPLVASNFRARLVHKDGTSTRFPLDHSQIFTGHIAYKPESRVHAVIEGKMWTIHIYDQDETYGVEPAWRLLKASENPYNDTMVVYKMSDLKDLKLKKPFCKAKFAPKTDASSDSEHLKLVNQSERNGPTYYTHVKREKRNTRRRDTCTMYLVGDADFFNKRCDRSHFSCSALMIHYLHEANNIFMTSRFLRSGDRELTGIGLQVSELILMTDYNNPSITQYKHFNEKYHAWSCDTKLDAFGFFMKRVRTKYCLNHLLTEFADADGVLGLAYVSQICRGQGRGNQAYNSGITSGTNKVNLLLPSLQIGLVLAHEIGHNFGSNHDPDSAECAPAEQKGGKYLMWRFAVTGHERNNAFFSPCSLRQIGRNLPGNCFVDRQKISNLCGNGLLEKGEECDGGVYAMKGVDKCCTSKCTFKRGAVCSDTNHECCINCKIASKQTVCRQVNSFSCQSKSLCAGHTAECIDGGTLPDGTACGERHKCMGGVCKSPCALEAIRRGRGAKLIPCQCRQNATVGCMFCCFDATDPKMLGKCKPISTHPRNDGTQCYKGFCRSGVCTVTVVQSGTRLDAYIAFVQGSSLAEFFRTNIVLVCILLSLIMWIPPSLWVHKQDMELEKQRDMLEDMLNEDDDEDDEYDDDFNYELENEDFVKEQTDFSWGKQDSDTSVMAPEVLQLTRMSKASGESIQTKFKQRASRVDAIEYRKRRESRVDPVQFSQTETSSSTGYEIAVVPSSIKSNTSDTPAHPPPPVPAAKPLKSALKKPNRSTQI